MSDLKNGSWKSAVLAVSVAVITAVPPTLMAFAAFNKSEDTHNLVNSRMTEMIELVRAAASAKATLKEMADEKARQSEAAAYEKLPNRIAK